MFLNLSLWIIVLNVLLNQFHTIFVKGQCSAAEYECNTLNGTLTFPNNSRCIPIQFLCDYDTFNFPIPDCPLGDDEWSCSSCGNNHNVTLPDGTTAIVDDYICPTTGICIPFEWSCANSDGIVDCWPGQEDVSQEVCEATNDEYIDCASEFIVTPGDPCFGDEDAGRSICFKCNNTNGRCINENTVCDDFEDCLDGQDELNCPTFQPTLIPSIIPTTIPTNNPSIIPSNLPSTLPSTLPSNQPTTIPTTIPSTLPTTLPSILPTSVPSINPSVNPSNLPSIDPTIDPSSNPTIIPTNQPVVAFTPTTDPTLSPTNFPTSPTNIPSKLPSNQPSLIPSELPSDIPSELPTNEPSVNPTIEPSEMPTDPSNQPTNNPTGIPSVIPTNNPNEETMEPSNLPTDMPTIPQTEGECCHARDNTNRYEAFCNDVTDIYITDCLSRDYINKCEWEINNNENCPIIKGSARNIGDVEVVCDCIAINDDGSRGAMACQYLEADECGTRGICKCAGV